MAAAREEDRAEVQFFFIIITFPLKTSSLKHFKG